MRQRVLNRSRFAGLSKTSGTSISLHRLLADNTSQIWLITMLLVACALLLPWFEASMARHMGLELPLLFIIGWQYGRAGGERLADALVPWNAYGLTALTFTAMATGFWMLPVALDLAVQYPVVGVIKAASLLIAGLLLGASWHRSSLVVQAFFMFNWCWMMVATGLIYQDAPDQLCRVYLPEEQYYAGTAIIFWAALAFVAWAVFAVRKSNLLDNDPKLN